MIDIKKLAEGFDSKSNTKTHTVYSGEEALNVKINKTISLTDYNAAVTRIQKWCFYDDGTGDIVYMPELMHCGLVLECTKVFTNINIEDVSADEAYVFLCDINILDLIKTHAESQYKALIKAVKEGIKHRLNIVTADKGVTQKLIGTLNKIQETLDSFKGLADSINLENIEDLIGGVQKSMTPENMKLIADTLKILE